MPSKHDEPLSPYRAALVLLYGKTDRKYRLLDRDVLVIGRASGADLRLEAPDVSNLHCIISHGPRGFQLRDCNSRAGTRINGVAVQEIALHDEDVLQIGPFSFRVQLPAGAVEGEKPVAPPLPPTNQQPPTTADDTGRQLGALRARVAEYDQRVRQLEQAERELGHDREMLKRDAADLDARVQQTEERLTRQQAEAEAAIARRWEEFEQRCRANDPPAPAPAPPPSEAPPARQGELDALAARLDERQRRLEDQEREVAGARARLAREAEQLHHERQERLKMREDWAREQKEANEQLAQRAAAVAQAEASLREQRATLLRMMNDLKQMQEALRTQDGEALAALQEENESLRRALAKRDEALASQEDTQQARERLHLERDQALAERDQALTERDQILQEALALQQGQQRAEPPAVDAEEVEKLHATVQMLRGLIEEKDALLDELQNRPAHPVTDSDLAAMESELNGFRRQLEADRKKLSQEIEALRMRNQELDEATRELELEMSRERAELARERQRLERLREEMRAEFEKGQREGGVRERLAPVHRLREEINERRQAPATPPPAPNGARPRA
jgi:pSer/pThr/pTyr-binding forkhead associated (FHA) protein